MWEKSLDIWEGLGKKPEGKGRRNIGLGRTFYPLSTAGAWVARAGGEEQVKGSWEERPFRMHLCVLQAQWSPELRHRKGSKTFTGLKKVGFSLY